MSNIDNAIEGIKTWIDSRSDGCWEHHYGLQICNTDNPGWLVDIIIGEEALADMNTTSNVLEFRFGEICGQMLPDRVRLYHPDLGILLTGTASYLKKMN